MDPTAADASEETTPSVVFRPSKKRKPYRQRADDDAEPRDKSAPTAPQPPPVNEAAASDEDGGPSVAEALRLRKQRRGRPGGVGFRVDDAARGEPMSENAEQSLVVHDAAAAAEADPFGGMTKRFAPQTGMVGELVNKHMEEYIESELARRHLAEGSHKAAAAQSASDSREEGATAAGAKPPVVQPTMQGKLQEIDLGEEARARNIAMTDRARRRLEGEAVEDDADGGTPRKVRLGRDGKPWRGRKRRASEDVKRDQLVEQFLHENRLEVYDVDALQQAHPNPSAGADEDGAADDRVAEEFRREFLEAMSARVQRKKPPAPPPSKYGAKKEEEVLKGPKLGGSRNARAAMRDLLLEQQEKQKGGRR